MGTKTQKLSNIVDSVVEWQSVFTGDGSTGLTAVAGRGYFIDTTSGTVTVTLPASPKIGDIVQLKDYARKWATNAVSIASAKFDGVAAQTPSFSTNGQTVTLVYMDGTKGWSLVNEDTTTGLGALYVAATGGTVTTSSDYKIHTFTGDGCFVVSQTGNPAGSDTVDYLVVAGGGSGGLGTGVSDRGGGGGAGGYRESSGAASGCYSASPLGASVSALSVTATTYPVTVGAGGAQKGSFGNGNNGSNSIFSTITSTGGGGGGQNNTTGNTGGSGGGAGGGCTDGDAGGSGNTPPVSPPQGNNGGTGGGTTPNIGGGGGGGATAVGGNAKPGGSPGGFGGGDGGTGATSSINGTPTERAGGGAGDKTASATGGGAAGPGACQAGTANTGGGGQGGHPCGGGNGSAGGKGIVILRYKFQN